MGKLSQLANKFMAMSKKERMSRKDEFLKKAQKIIDEGDGLSKKDKKGRSKFEQYKNSRGVIEYRKVESVTFGDATHIDPYNNSHYWDKKKGMWCLNKDPVVESPEKIVSRVVEQIESEMKQKPPKQIPDAIFNVSFEAMEKYHMVGERDVAKLAGCAEYLLKSDITGENPYWFKDNGSEILGVAHLDTVCMDRHFIIAPITGETLVFSPAIDNRLGAYTIAHLLPSLGITCDILLTTHEEKCKSTAELFVHPEGKKYKWIFSFDRKGDDVVMYQFENKKCKSRLEKCGFEVGWGSYSDIAELDTLGCKAFNFGCGYEDYHTRRSFFSLNVFKSQVKKFMGFYWRYKNTHMSHDPKDNHESWGYGGFGSGSDDAYWKSRTKHDGNDIDYKRWNDDYYTNHHGARHKGDDETTVDGNVKKYVQAGTFGEGCVYCGNSRSDINLFTYHSGYKICSECAREIGWDSESVDAAIDRQKRGTKRLSIEHPALQHGDTYCMDCSSQFFRDKTQKINDASCPECASINICGVV